jgi:ABC-type transport system involved in multi-copper enzyme maturation permease subunit
MSPAIIIAKNSIRETFRDRLFIVILIVAGLVVALSFLLGALSFDERTRILFNLGITAVHLVMLGLTVMMGSFSISRELERQTFVTVLARPATRGDFLMGKFLGVLFTMVLSIVLLSLLIYFILPQINTVNFIKIVLGILFEGSILLSFSIFFSLVFRPAVALFVTLGIFFIGHWLPDLQFFAEKSKSELYIQFSKTMQYIAPNLYQMNWRTFHFLETSIPNERVLWSFVHAVAWSGIIILVSQNVFKRRDFL